MSSLRNAISRRPHKERSQPTHRTKWGLLEKHKDYSLRAADYNAKQKKLNILAQKSREKHPDEFAFGMVGAGAAKQGKHGGRGDAGRLSHEAVRLLKTQDAGYLRGVMQRTRREVERVGEEGTVGEVLMEGRRGAGRGKVVFDEDGRPGKRMRVEETDADTDEVEGEALDGQSLAVKSTLTVKTAPKVLSTKQAQKEKDKLAQLKADRKRRKRLQELRTAKLEVLKKRQKDILAAADQLELQRAKMGNVIGGTNKHGVKFKVRERKR